MEEKSILKAISSTIYQKKNTKNFSKKQRFLTNPWISLCVLACLGLVEKGLAQSTDSTSFTEPDSLPIDSNTIAADTIDSTSSIPKTYTVMGVGDMMLGTAFPSPKYLPPAGTYLFRHVEELIQRADVSFGNLEGAILDSGPVKKRCKDTTKCYAFRMPERYAGDFQRAGFDLLSIANNHIRDFGDAGSNRSKHVLDSLNIAYAGLLTDPLAVIERNGTRFGLCAFSPNNGTTRIEDIPRAVKLVKRLDEQCDILIVSFHGGAEGKDNQHVTRETEMYYGEDRGNVHAFSHALIDAGADVIFGHGPHVVRAMEIYQDRLICYSLGNFCTYARFNLSGPNALAPVVEVELNADGSLMKGKIHSFLQLGEGGPVHDGSKRALRKMKELTLADFPENTIVFEEDGSFYAKP